ncbi:MAG TPA: endopeptidase La [Porphyromonadaceae bacterium]|nr:endopeptidase La [Porphyromonadaceae bacterium]
MSDNSKISPSCGILQVGQTVIDPSKQPPIPSDVGNLPVIPTRNLVLFPGITMPLNLVREQAKEVAAMARKERRLIGLSCQKDGSVDEITSASELCDYGSLVEVLEIFDLPDNMQAAVVRAVCKYRLLGDGQAADASAAGMMHIAVKPITQPRHRKDDAYGALTTEILNRVKEYKDTGGDLELNVVMSLDNLDRDDVINFISTSFPLSVPQKIELLSIYRLNARGERLLEMIGEKLQELRLANSFKEKARVEMEKGHREAFMREEMEAIRKELYGDSDPSEELRRKAETLPLPQDVKRSVDRDLAQLSRTNPNSPDFAVLSGYLDTLLDLPWGVTTELNSDFNVAEKVLDSDHYGLTKVKERILEQIAVIMNNPEGHAPILCLVGPPGVGKTSLGQSVAKAMGRKYHRVSLGGLHDEAEIRGHRRTYIGAMPGRIITALRKAGSMNPVLLLDEVDKIGADYKGDPAAALLEVLDPEQNCRYHDNYLDVDFDLSNVLFIATANTLQTLSQPLLDRMEIIELSGYATEEKIEIARRHLIPRILKANNLEPESVMISDEGLVAVIDGYTSESGVRLLEKALSKIVRKLILARMRGQAVPDKIGPDEVAGLLGKPTRLSERYEGNDIPGVVTGLAWTAAGGEILFIEAAVVPEKNGNLSLTGNLGDVMKESATLALQYVRGHAAELGVDPSAFDGKAIHIHVPAGAIPKDGPSAGVTMVTAMVSALTGRKVRHSIAMTGEITLRGRVTAIGGVKEKVLAARRAGITHILLPEDNRRDVDEIEKDFLAGIDFSYYSRISDLLDFALEK